MKRPIYAVVNVLVIAFIAYTVYLLVFEDIGIIEIAGISLMTAFSFESLLIKLYKNIKGI